MNQIKIKKNIRYLVVIIIIIIYCFFLFKYIPVIRCKFQGDCDQITTTGDINNIIQTPDVTAVSGSTNTGSSNSGISVNSEILYVHDTLSNGVGGKDYSVITPKIQNIDLSISAVDGLNRYLSNNIYSLEMPKDIKGGYLYIKLHKALKYMSSIKTYQPITIKTNIYFNGRGTYGRLDTQSTLPVNLNNQEFLYKLDDVPIRGAKGTNWLVMKGKRLQIGGFVSDTKGNYIEKIVFIWKR